MKFKLAEIQPGAGDRIAVPDIIHFVWTGDSSRINFDYIDVWLKTNKDKTFFLWLDTRFEMCDFFHESIHQHVINTIGEECTRAEMRIKNCAFAEMFPKITSGHSFDELASEFLSVNNIQQSMPVRPKVDVRQSNRRIIIKDIAKLFTPEFYDFMKYYCYELILRGNLASASDIVRLLIIYAHGGIYVDMDTLPYTDNAFSRLNVFLKHEGIEAHDAVLLMKTELILNIIGHKPSQGRDPPFYDGDSIAGLSQNKQETIKWLIEQDMSTFTLKKITPLGELFVHKNLLAIGSLKRLKGVYFNHFMASHPKSKAVRIILRTMKKRYQFLETNNCIFEVYKGGCEEQYLSRILPWRTELISREYGVTPVLTGPGLIIEVMLGLAYQLLDLDNEDPSVVAEFFQDEEYGIAMYQHNLDTPCGCRSAWRK